MDEVSPPGPASSDAVLYFPGMNPDFGLHMLWIKAELTRLRSTWKPNVRFVPRALASAKD